MYNQSQFSITSFGTRHNFLVEGKNRKQGQIKELERVKNILGMHSKEIIEYLACAKISKQNELNMTVDDMF